MASKKKPKRGLVKVSLTIASLDRRMYMKSVYVEVDDIEDAPFTIMVTGVELWPKPVARRR